MRRSLLLIALTLSLAGCWRQSPPPLPTGVQTVSGLVEPVALSLIRRGTHVLVQGGEKLYYLESAQVNLGTYEGREVEVRGTLEPNTDARELPVLVVTSVIGTSQRMRTWEIPSLGLSIDVPREWKGKIVSDTAQFTGSGSSEPILTIFREGPEQWNQVTGSGSSSSVDTLRLGTRSAVRLKSSATFRERIMVDLRRGATDASEGILTLLLTPTEEEVSLDLESWEALVTSILRSIHFSGDTVSSSSARSASSAASLSPVTGSGAGMPCGGTAGILCPSGFFCEISDTESNTGLCRKM